MNLSLYIPEGTLETLREIVAFPARFKPKQPVYTLGAHHWERILAPGYQITATFQAACLGHFDDELAQPMKLYDLPLPADLRRFACFAARGKKVGDLAQYLQVAKYHVQKLPMKLKRCWNLPYNNYLLHHQVAAQYQYAPPPLLSTFCLSIAWEATPHKNDLWWACTTGKTPYQLNASILHQFGLRTWSGLPIVLQALYPTLLEEVPARYRQKPKLSEKDENHLLLISRGWSAHHISNLRGQLEEEVCADEERIKRQLRVYSRIELGLIGLIRHPRQERI